MRVASGITSKSGSKLVMQFRIPENAKVDQVKAATNRIWPSTTDPTR